MSSSAACALQPYSRVTARASEPRVVPRRRRERAVEVRELVSPAAEDRRVLAVDVAVRIDRLSRRVRVMAHDHVAACVAQHLEALGHRGRIAGRLDHDVGSAPADALVPPAHAVLGPRDLRRCRARPRRPPAAPRPAGLSALRDEHPARRRELREDRRVQPHGSAALDHDGVRRAPLPLARPRRYRWDPPPRREFRLVETLGEPARRAQPGRISMRSPPASDPSRRPR